MAKLYNIDTGCDRCDKLSTENGYLTLCPSCEIERLDWEIECNMKEIEELKHKIVKG